MKGLAASGCLMLDRLRLDGQTVAALVSFRDGPRAYAWKTAFDETHARSSLGIQVTLAAMENYFSFEDLVEVDSLGGRVPSYVEDLWPDRTDFGTLMIAGGSVAFARFAAARVDIAAREGARRSVKKIIASLPGKH
ncbi:GNAT family N-acetyltransferase [Breoghania sp.]|uniref:GNAT family N-acetyltransferase n=1 Tax=Breoghania sp. TaxID=2065378 RepID=UPI002622CCDA|nr:GNAT family N-acetyltransferase [Breoghania sp.]MDJ0930507.1 GNAT family N-acetyltransferase [Breoghania sp.]